MRIRRLGNRNFVRHRGKKYVYYTNFYGKRIWPGLVEVDAIGIQPMRSPVPKELIAFLRKTVPAQIAEEMCSVQPMPHAAFQHLYDAAMTEEQLVAEGYEPVSHLGLMWRNKDGSKEEHQAEEGDSG